MPFQKHAVPHGQKNAARAATGTTCRARCRDGSLSVSVYACFFSCFSDAGSIAKSPPLGVAGMLPMRKCCQSPCCQFSIGARRGLAAWKAAFPVSGRAGARPSLQGWGEASRRAEDGSPYRRQDGGSPCGSGRRQSCGLLSLKLLDDASLRHDRLVAAQVEDELLLPGEVSYRNHSNVWPILKSRIAGSSPVRSMTKSCVTLQMPTEASFSETSAWT